MAYVIALQTVVETEMKNCFRCLLDISLMLIGASLNGIGVLALFHSSIIQEGRRRCSIWCALALSPSCRFLLTLRGLFGNLNRTFET